MTVAWHAVPGQRAPNEPSRRVRYDRCGCTDGFDDRSRCGFIKPFQTCETLLGNKAMAHSAFLKQHGAHLDEKYLRD